MVVNFGLCYYHKMLVITVLLKFFIVIDSLFYRVIHVFPWSGIVNENFELNDTFRVPSLKEGRMVRLISQLSTKEEEMFRNMVRRVNTLVKVCDNCYMQHGLLLSHQPHLLQHNITFY